MTSQACQRAQATFKDASDWALLPRRVSEEDRIRMEWGLLAECKEATSRQVTARGNGSHSAAESRVDSSRVTGAQPARRRGHATHSAWIRRARRFAVLTTLAYQGVWGSRNL